MGDADHQQLSCVLLQQRSHNLSVHVALVLILPGAECILSFVNCESVLKL